MVGWNQNVFLQIEVGNKCQATQNPSFTPTKCSGLCKLWIKKSLLRIQECQQRPSLPLNKPLSPKRLRLGHAEIFNPSIWEPEARSRPAQVTSPKTNTSASATCKPFLALGTRNRTLGLWDPLCSLPHSSQEVLPPRLQSVHPIVFLPKSTILLLLHYKQAQFFQKWLELLKQGPLRGSNHVATTWHHVYLPLCP